MSAIIANVRCAQHILDDANIAAAGSVGITSDPGYTAASPAVPRQKPLQTYMTTLPHVWTTLTEPTEH